MKDKQNKEEQLGCNTTVYEIHAKPGLHVAQPQCFEQMGLHVHTLYSLVSLFQPPLPAPPLKGGVTPFCGLHSTCRWTFCWNGYVLGLGSIVRLLLSKTGSGFQTLGVKYPILPGFSVSTLKF